MLTKQTREAQVLLASSTMKYMPRNRGVRIDYKTYHPFPAKVMKTTHNEWMYLN